MPPLHRRAAAQAAFDGGFGLLQGHDPTLEGPPDVLQSTDDDDGDVPWPSVGDPPEDRPASTSSEVSSSPATSSLKPISRRATWSSKSGEGPVSSRTHLLSRALASSYSNEIRRSWRYCASASGPALPSASSRVTLPSTCGPASLSPSSPICPSHAPEPSSPACSATQALRCEGPHVILQWEFAAKHTSVCPATLRATYWRAWYDVSIARRLDRSAFAPPPSVDAAVVRLERRARPLLPLESHVACWSFLRAAFETQQPIRRSLRRSLSPLEIKRLAPALGFAREARASQLDAEQWAKLFAFARGLETG
jgi:hypothetical protein